jgi:hypothetical protein
MPIDPAPAPPDLVPLSKLPNFDPRTVPVVAIDSHLPPWPPSADGPTRCASASARRRLGARAAGRAALHQPRSRPTPSVLVPIVLREQADGAAHRAHHAPVDALRPDRLSRRQARPHRHRRGAHGAARGARGDRPGGACWSRCWARCPLHHRHRSSSRRSSRWCSPTTAGAEPLRGGRRLRGAAGVPDEPGAPPPPRHRAPAACSASGSRCPTWTAHERFIWGATAAMLRNFYRFLAA